jgi:hypothetical protein
MIHMANVHVHKPNHSKNSEIKELSFLPHDTVGSFQNKLVNIMAYRLNKVKTEVPMNIQQQLKL